MNILDLLKKYESNEIMEYLRQVFGSNDYINDIFTDTMTIKYIIKNRNLDYRIYEIFHNVYKNVADDKSIDNTILNCLIILESYYTVYSKSRNELDRTKSENKRFSIDSIPKDYKYYTLAKQINSDIKDFSLYEIFNNNAIFDEKEGFNAATVISRTQTISRFNETKFNDMKGSGYHDTNFDEILKAIYGRKFNYNISGQDIMIRYATYKKSNGKLSFNMLLAIPLVINSTQKIALENLNNEIKNLENYLNEDIYINISVVDYDTYNHSNYYNDETNLDSVLNELIINDYINDKYEELCFIGYSNLDNHYKKVDYVR